MNSKQIIEKVYRLGWGDVSELTVQKIVQHTIKLCSEAHRGELSKISSVLAKKAIEHGKIERKLEEKEKEIEALKKSRDIFDYAHKQDSDRIIAITESIDTLQRKVDEGTRKLIDKIYDLNHFCVADVGTIKVHHAEKYILIDKEELRQTLKGEKA